MTLLPTWWPKGGILKGTVVERVPATPERTESGIIQKIKLTRKQKIFFLDTIGSLVGAGIPIVKSLQLIYFQSKDKNVKELCLFAKTQIERGRNLATVSRDIPLVFSNFDVAMFEMGDATGKIGQIFTTLMEKEEKMLEIERKVMGALVYPMAVVSVAVLMVVGLLIFVIPRIELIYREAHTSLPPLTQGVIWFSHFIQSYGILILIAGIIAGIGLKFLAKKRWIRLFLDTAILQIPILGKLIRYRILVIFTDFLSLLLSSGITIHRALEIVREGMPNLSYQLHIDAIIAEIRLGKHLSGAIGGEYLDRRLAGEDGKNPELAASKQRLEAFTIELSTSVKVGETTGTLASMLTKSAKRYEKEIDTIVKSLSSLLEPVVIIVIGAIVGVIILAIMMPFFNMAKVIS